MKFGIACKVSILLVAAVLMGCDFGAQKEPSNSLKSEQFKALQQQVVQTNAEIGYAVYRDAAEQASQLLKHLQTFVESPTDSHFAAAKAAWLAAREPYGQSEVYRFRGGPIDVLKDNGDFGAVGDGPEGRINAWPLGEALIDYVATRVDGDAGPENPTNVFSDNIVSSTLLFPEITKEVLKEYFEHGEDERNITTGYHAIEFLLWGQDLNADGGVGLQRDSSPGNRPVSDFYAQEQGAAGTCTSGTEPSPALVCSRRGQYLLAAAELLVEDLDRIAKVWHPETGSHFKAFVQSPDQSLSDMLESMGRLSFGELAGERINIALSTDSQEDEHSCFSDNTHRDIYLNILGVQNTFLGNYTRVDGQVIQGASIYDLLKQVDNQTLAEDLQLRLNKTMQAASVLVDKAENGQPFDVLIQEGVGQTDINAVIQGLISQTDAIERVINVLQLDTGALDQDTEQDLGV